MQGQQQPQQAAQPPQQPQQRQQAAQQPQQAAQGQQPPQQASQQPPFALLPGNVGNVINYATSEGMKHFKMATAPLKTEYDLSPADEKHFLGELATRAKEAGFEDVLQVPETDDPFADLINMLTEYGRLSLARIREHEETYINNQARAAQDSAMLGICLQKSLTKQASKIITRRAHKYTIGDIVSGPLLLKVILLESRVDTQFTTKAIRDSIRDTPQIMQDQAHDIQKFNDVIEDAMQSLAARGEEVGPHLMTDLFKGYKSCPDTVFVDYIQAKENDFDEYEGDAPMSPERLMNLALNKFKQRKDQGLWNAPTEDQEKIIALEAKLKQLEQKAKSKTRDQAIKQQQQQQQQQQSSAEKSKKKKKERKPPPAWQLKPPAEGQSLTKKVDGKDFHWCKTHKKWGGHLHADCMLKKKLEQEANANNAGGNNTSNPQLQLAQSLQAVVDSE